MKDINKFKKMGLAVNVWGTNHITIRTNAGVVFVSYNSIVAFKANDTGIVTLGSEWQYGNVTIRNICQWLGVDSVKAVRQGIKDGTYLYDGDL